MYRLWEFVNFEREINLFFVFFFNLNEIWFGLFSNISPDVELIVVGLSLFLNVKWNAFCLFGRHGTAEMIKSQQDSSSPCGISSSLFAMAAQRWLVIDIDTISPTAVRQKKPTRFTSSGQKFFFPLFFFKKFHFFFVCVLSIWCNNVRWGAYRSICEKKTQKQNVQFLLFWRYRKERRKGVLFLVKRNHVEKVHPSLPENKII